jgi:hypothetical protein
MVRVIALLLACLCASGCFVFDEIDAGQKVLEETSPKQPGAAPATAGAPGEAGEQAGPPTGEAWWAKARSVSGPVSDEDGNNPAVTCKIGGSTRFMRKNDCLSRGGQPRA